MAHTHEFDCKLCGAHLDSKQELSDHTRENHQARGASDRADSDSSGDGSYQSPPRESNR
jgi:hypothetical protein